MAVTHFNTRADALEDAIFDSNDGDEVYIHEDDCVAFDQVELYVCSCDPLVVTVNGRRSVLDGQSD